MKSLMTAICLLLFRAVALPAADLLEADGGALVISIVADSPRFWCGLNAAGKFVSVSGQPAFSTYRERIATVAERKELAADLERHGLMKLNDSYRGPAELELRRPGLPLTRVTFWWQGRTHEISVAGMASAPEILQQFVQKVSALCEAAPESQPCAAARLVSLDRRYGPDGETYAQTMIRAGKHFTEIDAAALPGGCPALDRAWRHPGTVEALGEQDLRWLAGLSGWTQNRLLVKVAAGYYDLSVLKPAGFPLDLAARTTLSLKSPPTVSSTTTNIAK